MPDDAMPGENVAGVASTGRCDVKQAVGRQRQELAEFEIAAADGLHDHLVVAHHGDGGLGHGLGNHRIDLARHDRRAGLPRRQPDFAQPGVRAGREQPQVVGDLQQVHGQRAEDAADLDQGVGVLRGLDQVLGPGQSQAGDLPQMLDDAEDVLPRCAEARADGRAAEVHHPQPLLALVDSPAVAGRCASA